MKQIFLTALLLASVQISVAGHHEALPMEGGIMKCEMTEATKEVPIQHLPAFNVGAAEASFEAPEIITEIPAGESKYYEKQSAGYYLEWTSFLEYREEFAARIVFTEDGEVYFPNFMSKYNYEGQGYIKGKLSDDGKNILVTFPQTFCYAPDGSDLMGTLYVGKVNNGEEVTCEYISDPTVVNFEIDEEGFIDMQEDIEIVLIWSDGGFSGFADYEQHYFIIDSPADIPQNVATEEWAMLYGIAGHFVKVGFNDDMIYIKGFSELLPDAVLVGYVKDNLVEFDNGQFMGVYGTSMVSAVFGYLTPEGSFEYYDVDDKIIFDYNLESKVLVPATSECLLFTKDKNQEWYIESYYIPQFEFQGFVIPAAPVKPELAWVDESPAEYGETHVWFYLPPFNVNGKLVNLDNYFYNVYIDGDLYVLHSADYVVLEDYGLTEISNIPYTMALGPGLAVMGSAHGLVLLAVDIFEIGIQSFIIEDGIEYRSEMLTCSTSKVEELDSNNGEIISREYFDISGKKITGDYKGIVIERQTTSDGSIKVNKVIRR